MEDKDTNHFDDFTTASELEIFIARLEEVIQDWGLNKKKLEKPLMKNDFKTKEWAFSVESVNFADVEFSLFRHYLKCDTIEEQDEGDDGEEAEEVLGQPLQDMMSLENDFFTIGCLPKDSLLIPRWYGLRDFLVLIPSNSCIVTESKIKILLSSLSIAIANTNCVVPFFVQTLEPSQFYFMGVYQSGSFRTEFNMAHLKRAPLHCKYLTGLLTLFKSKIGLRMDWEPVMMTVRFSYILNFSSSSQKVLPYNEVVDLESLQAEMLDNLLFAPLCSSIEQFNLNAMWPSLSESSVFDGENYSDLEPLRAPLWKVFVTFADNPDCWLTNSYEEFVALSTQNALAFQSIWELFGKPMSTYYPGGRSSEAMSSLNALTESKITALSKAVIGVEKPGKRKGSSQSQQIEGPISEKVLMVFLYFMFPDADSTSKSPYDSSLSGEPNTPEKHLHKRLEGMKSAPYDGLVWRLCIIMSHVIRSPGCVRSAAYLWYKFTEELRFRIEKGILIPGLEPGNPDYRTCLLNQKLQLLNICIQRRLEREKNAREAKDESESDCEEDVFYDCVTEPEEDNENTGSRVNYAPWDKPVGRLRQHDDLKLLETGERLYVPVTQFVPPKTEDEMREDEDFLLKLGDNDEGSEIRQRLMSATLLSDMQAFRAANPGCVLADFIRWYSPRDWIEDEDGAVNEFGQKKGRLSNRMQVPDNMWLNNWEVSRPLPAKWQRRLFNDTRVCEGILEFLERKTVKEFIELLLPVMIVCVLQKLLLLLEEDKVPGVDEILSRLIAKAKMLNRQPQIIGNRYQALVHDIELVESQVVNWKSLKNEFTVPDDKGGGDNGTSPAELMAFLKNLLQEKEAEVPGDSMSSIRSIIKGIFAKNMESEQFSSEPIPQSGSKALNVLSPFTSPQEKEMILRLDTPMKGPQRLHAIIMKNQFRLCGAFTKNIYHL